MKIKTVCEEISRETKTVFDEEVNALLEDGWQLAKREVIPGYNLGDVYFPPCLYAELVKLDEADMEPQEDELPAWEDAVDALRLACGTAEDCTKDGCPVYAWCDKNLRYENPPSAWDDPRAMDRPE